MLIELICQEITRQQAPISFADYMQLALYHQQWGYYNQASFKLGKDGDFITAPEISPLFAMCIARQIQQIFAQIPQAAILEIGAGSGQLAHDLLTALIAAGMPPEQYLICEISPALRAHQQQFLQTSLPDYFHRIQWLDDLPQSFSGVILANEVLDALPTHCFQLQAGKVLEKRVTWTNQQFAWQLVKPEASLERAINSLVVLEALPDNYASEINLQAQVFIKNLANCLQQGVILLLDYGYGQREFYHPERTQGTLTCFHKHRKNNNPFLQVGQQDITAHVDFTQVISTAVQHELTLLGFTTQASFLLACGLIDIASNLEMQLTEVEQFTLHQAIKLLTLPTEMGDIIKVMALGKAMDISLLGFQWNDRSRDL